MICNDKDSNNYLTLTDCYNSETEDKVLMDRYNKPLKLIDIEIGKVLKVKYKDGNFFSHELVIDYEECGDRIWVCTTRKTWRFDYCK